MLEIEPKRWSMIIHTILRIWPWRFLSGTKEMLYSLQYKPVIKCGASVENLFGSESDWIAVVCSTWTRRQDPNGPEMLWEGVRLVWASLQCGHDASPLAGPLHSHLPKGPPRLQRGMVHAVLVTSHQGLQTEHIHHSLLRHLKTY